MSPSTPPPKPTPTPAPAPVAPKASPTLPIGNQGQGQGQMPMGVAVAVDGQTGAVTARQAGGLIDMKLPVSPKNVSVPAALQNLAKAVNVAFQTNYGENLLESVYQAAIVRKGEIVIVHKEYFGFGTGWLSSFGMFLKSLQLTVQGPDPASPEGQRLIAESQPRTIRGLLNLVGRKLDIIPEYEDKVPAYVEQMFDRLESSGIIVGWNREEWNIRTTNVGLNIRISPKP